MDHNVVGLAAVVLLFGGPLIAGIVWIICHTWAQVATHQGELELKHRLLDAGMTASEIERVVNSGRVSEASGAGTPEPRPEVHKVA
jgi:hypothetical protein